MKSRDGVFSRSHKKLHEVGQVDPRSLIPLQREQQWKFAPWWKLEEEGWRSIVVGGVAAKP